MTKKKKAKTGRPPVALSPEQVQLIEGLASRGCTNEEIAAALNISSDTLTRRFAEAIKKGKLLGNVSMKRKLFDMAQSGNLGARIWYGKQYMGERERIDENVKVKDVTHLNEAEFAVSWQDDSEGT